MVNGDQGTITIAEAPSFGEEIDPEGLVMRRLLVYFTLDILRSCVVDIPVHRRRVIPSTGTGP